LIVQKQSDDLRAAVLDPVTRTKLETIGNYPNPLRPSGLLAFIQSEQQCGSPCWSKSRAIHKSMQAGSTESKKDWRRSALS